MSNAAQLVSLAGQFKAATTGWMTTAIGYAKDIFGSLAVLEFVWSGAQYALRKNDLPEFITSAFLKILTLSFFFFVLIDMAPTFIPDILNSFLDIGTSIAGVPQISPASPGTFVDLGIQTVVQLFNGLGKMSLGNEIGALFPVTLAAIFILAAFVIIAAQILITLIESYIVVGAGAVMLGFLGSRWTTTFGEKYYGYAVSIGIKLMVIELIAGLGLKMAGVWLTELMAAHGVQLSMYFDIATGSVLFAALAIMVPSLAGSFMNGSPSLSLGNMGAAGAAVAGGVVAAGAEAAMGAASLANSAIGAGKAAGSLASSANTAMGGMKGLGAAFQEGAGAAGESGILGLGAGTAGARMAGGLTGLAGQAASGMGTASKHGLRAVGGMARDRFHGVSGRKAQEVANGLGDKAVQGHGETTAGGNFANRVRAQQPGDVNKGNSVGLGAAPDAGPNNSGNVGGGSGGGSGPSDPNAGAAMGSTASAGNGEGSTAAGIPGEKLGNTAAGRPNDGVPSKGTGDSIGSGGKGNLSGQPHGPRFDTRPDHEQALSALDKIKERNRPRGFPHDGGGVGAGGPRITHTE
ncbi:P-type conjugative transfer protein TrbL [Acidithiobacillus sp.]